MKLLNLLIYQEKQGEAERHRETERQRDRESQRDRQRERETDRQREAERGVLFLYCSPTLAMYICISQFEFERQRERAAERQRDAERDREIPCCPSLTALGAQTRPP